MNWQIPAKTFLLGEYAAITEASAILLTTTPFFELTLTNEEGLIGIHPQSPAGLWWQKNLCSGKGLSWYDPYKGRGGLGASSAQFLGCYLATCSVQNKTPDLNSLLKAYYQSAWTGTGLRPSGYDVIAQSQHGCVYINKQKKSVQSYPWPFKDLSFILLHTGIKLATHYHLQDTALPSEINNLSHIVDVAKEAFELANSNQIVNAINAYHEKLSELNLVAPHSLDLIQSLKSHSEVLAIKGCGALGADILLIITAYQNAQSLRNKLLAQNWLILATEENITQIAKESFIENSL